MNNRMCELIKLTPEAKKVYKEWAAMKRFYTGIHHISNFIIELLESDIREMQLKKQYTSVPHSQIHTQIDISSKQLELIDWMHKNFSIEEYDEEFTPKIPLLIIKNQIRRIFGYSNEKTINREKNVFCENVRFHQIREGNKYYLVPNYPPEKKPLSIGEVMEQ